MTSPAQPFPTVLLCIRPCFLFNPKHFNCKRQSLCACCCSNTQIAFFDRPDFFSLFWHLREYFSPQITACQNGPIIPLTHLVPLTPLTLFAAPTLLAHSVKSSRD